MTGFPHVLTAGEAVVARQPNQRFQQYLLICPNTVVFQTQPDSAVDGSIPYASFDWSGVDQGAFADVLPGMTVFFSTSSDYKATAFFRGRARLAPDATTFYVNETSANLAVTDYITVVDDYDIHERLERRTAANVAYKDWDLTFTRLPPTISGLQSVYADLSGAATVTFSFAPTVTANASGATISSYLWDVADGTASPNLTTKDISVQFPGAATNEQRWVRLTATDSLGNSQYFVFEVYTVNRHSASPTAILLTADQVQISASVDEGYNATIRAWDGMSAVLDQTRVSIATLDDYNGCKALAFTSGGTVEVVAGNTITGATSAATAVVVAVDLTSGTWAGGNAVGTLWVNEQSGTFESENLNVGVSLNVATIAADSINTPFTTNIAFVGRLRNENNSIAGDARHAVLADTAFTIEGFKTQINHIIGPGTPITYASAATNWNQIQGMTVGRIVIFALTWHSTFLNISGLTLPSDIHDYEWREAYNLQPNPLSAWVADIVDDINAWMVFASDGESAIRRHASYAGVSGLDTIILLQTDDSGGNSDFDNWSLEYDYIPTNSQALAGAATYDTTLNKARVWRGQAPAQVYGPGWGQTALNQQIMKSDLTDTQAKAETGSRVAAHLAYTNPHARITGTMKDGYYWITPSVYQLYSFTIAASVNTRGRAYTSADKWICTDVSYSYNPTTGRVVAQHTFEIVTTGGNYGITVTPVIDVNDLGYPPLPPISAGLDGFDPIANYPIEDPDFELPGYGGGTVQPGNPPTPEIGCDYLNVSMKNGTPRTTHNLSVFGEVYAVQAEGEGIVIQTTSEWYAFFDFSQGQLGWTKVDGTTYPCHYTASDGWYSDFGATQGGNEIRIHLTFDNTVITQAQVFYDRDAGGGLEGGFVRVLASSVIKEQYTGLAIDSGTNKNYSIDFIGGFTVDEFYTNVAFTDLTGNERVRCSGIALRGTGTAPVQISGNATTFIPGGSGDIRGDAFYYDYQDGGVPTLYGGGYGLRVDGDPPTIPPYSSNHVYTFPVTGTGNVIGFDFEDGDLSDNSNNNIVITICGAGMSFSAL